MLKVIRTFLDRLAERLVVISAGLVSSSVETLQAVGQADQQSRLEDLARRYEADGKPEIAAMLRERVSLLSSDNPAERALPILSHVSDCEIIEQEPIEADTSQETPLLEETDLTKLPDFSATTQKNTSDKKKRHKRNSSRYRKGRE